MNSAFAAPRTHDEKGTVKPTSGSGSAKVTSVHAGRLSHAGEAGIYSARSETCAKSEVNIGCSSFRRLYLKLYSFK
jgi:RES domain-containing protein